MCEVIESPFHQGWVFNVKNLQQIRRILNEVDISLPDIPDFVFKIVQGRKQSDMDSN